LVSSTVLGRCATTFVKTNLRRLRLSCFGILSMVLRYESGPRCAVVLLPERLDECLMNCCVHESGTDLSPRQRENPTIFATPGMYAFPVLSLTLPAKLGSPLVAA
jgi:hypothetical protein